MPFLLRIKQLVFKYGNKGYFKHTSFENKPKKMIQKGDKVIEKVDNVVNAEKYHIYNSEIVSQIKEYSKNYHVQYKNLTLRAKKFEEKIHQYF